MASPRCIVFTLLLLSTVFLQSPHTHVVASTVSTTTTSTTERAGANLLGLCSPCRYDAQCTSCKCVGHRCVPEKDPHFVCNKPTCARCKKAAECAVKSCIWGRCVASSKLYYNCPGTRPYCYQCKVSSTCKTGNCVKDKCAKNRRDYYANCPGTRPVCTTCTKSLQCQHGLYCYKNKCVKSKPLYYDCPGTRGRCDTCAGKPYVCASPRKCYGGICVKNSGEYDACTKCCVYDACRKKNVCVKKGGTLYDACKSKIFLYDKHTCRRSIFSCCFTDACSGHKKCIRPNGVFRDSCGAEYKVRRDCKLVQQKREELCCYSDKCFVTGLKIKKKCVKKGGSLKDTCGGVYDVGRDCSLKRRVCCYKVSCAHKTYCRSVGSIIHVPCGRSFKVMPSCRIAALHRQVILNMFNKQAKSVGDGDGSDVPSLIPISERVEQVSV